MTILNSKKWKKYVQMRKTSFVGLAPTSRIKYLGSFAFFKFPGNWVRYHVVKT